MSGGVGQNSCETLAARTSSAFSSRRLIHSLSHAKTTADDASLLCCRRRNGALLQTSRSVQRGASVSEQLMYTVFVLCDGAKRKLSKKTLIFTMACKLYLGVRLNPVEKMTVIKLDEVNLKETVDKLRTETAQQTNLSNDAFDLIYCGCLLENNSTLESYGLKSGSMVHVLKRDDIKESTMSTSSSNSESNVEMLINIFKSFAVNPLLELAMRRLTKKADFIKNIISSSPGLSDDTVAIAILQDPDLIIHFTNPETLHKIAKTHPALLEAAQNIASAVHEEAHNFAVSTANAASPSGSAQNMGNSYHLENFSDDEEMAADSSQSSDSTQPSNSNSRSQSIISHAQLLAALQRARRSTSGNGNTSSDASPSVPSSSQSSANSGGVITFEMFNQAMQQAFATSAMNDIANAVPASAPPAPPVTNPNPTSTDDIQRQITIMHEMGLRNDAINLQALQITNGDVQAAIELVLSGFGEN